MKNEKSNYMKLFQISTLIYLFGMTSILFIRMFSNFSNYVPTLWTIHYTEGIRSRGFIGTIIYIFFPVIDYKHLYMIISLTTILVATVLIVLSLYFLHRNHYSLDVFLILAIANASPFFLRTFFADFGRFDTILFLFFLFSLWLALQRRWSYLLPVILFIAILIHEMYFIVYLPVILVIFFLFNSHQLRTKIIFSLFMFILSLGEVYWVKIIQRPTLTLEQLIDSFQSRVLFPLNAMALRNEYFFTLTDHMQFTFQTIFLDPKRLFNVFFMGLLLMPFLVFFFFYWKKLFQLKILPSLQSSLLLLSTLSPLIMSFIGIDYGRWFILLFTIQFMVMITLHQLNKYKIEVFLSQFGQWKIKIVVFLIVHGIAIGELSPSLFFSQLGNRIYIILISILN